MGFWEKLLGLKDYPYDNDGNHKKNQKKHDDRRKEAVKKKSRLW